MAQQHAGPKVALLKLFTLIPLRGSTLALIERKRMWPLQKTNKKKPLGCNEANVKVVFGLGPTEEILCELVQ